MKKGTVAFAALVIIPLMVSATTLYADIQVTPPTKPWHVTELTADTPACDSPTTYAYNVTWKPVYETWNPRRAPHIWKHYVVQTYNCAVTSIIVCDALCTTRASSCSIKQAASWIRIFTFLNDDETSKGSFMQIGGMPRPPLTLVGKTWQCVR